MKGGKSPGRLLFARRYIARRAGKETQLRVAGNNKPREQPRKRKAFGNRTIVSLTFYLTLGYLN